MSTKKVQRR